MFRKKLIPLLLHNSMSVAQIARSVRQPPAEIADDLAHLLRSLKYSEYSAVVTPARCRACGFEFSSDKLTKPSKCPECKGTWLQEPQVRLEEKQKGGGNRMNSLEK
jgi:transcriptional regulator